MNVLRNLELSNVRSYQTNVNAQSRILFDLIQKEIDINKASRCILVKDIKIFEENISLLIRAGISVSRAGNDYTLTW